MCELDATRALDNFGNALIEVRRLYYAPYAELSAQPECVELLFVFADGSDVTAILPINGLDAAALKKIVPRFHVSRKARGDFEATLYEAIFELHQHAKCGLLQPTEGEDACFGYAFESSGLHRLPDGSWVYVLGDQVLGQFEHPCYIEKQRDIVPRIAPISEPLPRLFSELVFADPQVLLGIAFLAATLLRSWLKEITSSWQAVLSIVGGQGLGKTTLAKQLTDWLKDEDGSPAQLFSAGSTPAAIREAMISARDLPLVIDDLCLSASPQLERKYRDLGAQFVREGANEASIVKKRPGGQNVQQRCRAGVILTAEFALENASDITRCIFINVDAPLNLPPTLSSDLIGAAVKSFLQWFLAHEPQARKALITALHATPDPQFHPRVCFNFTILSEIFQLLIHAAADAGLSAETANRIRARYEQAVEKSVNYQFQLLENLDRQRKKGNLAALLMAGYKKEVFDLTRKVEKLSRHEGIMWKRDMCLRREPLERFVRLQDGYKSYTISKIVQELKDIGALVLQEEGTAQVKIKRDAPRVYRIRIDVLKQVAEDY